MRVAIDAPLLLLRHGECSNCEVLHRVCKPTRRVGEKSRPTTTAGLPIHAGTASPDVSLEGERKTVTMLFADIKGSMESIEGLDPEEARAIVEPVLKLMIDAVHYYEGYVAQTTGDGIYHALIEEGVLVRNEQRLKAFLIRVVNTQQV